MVRRAGGSVPNHPELALHACDLIHPQPQPTPAVYGVYAMAACLLCLIMRRENAGAFEKEFVDRGTLIRHLREVEGLTFRAIGQHLGISQQAAWQAYQRVIRPKEARKPRRKPRKYQ